MMVEKRITNVATAIMFVLGGSIHYTPNENTPIQSNCFE